jgi:tRNA(fMet)-specific endonuclease VapC
LVTFSLDTNVIVELIRNRNPNVRRNFQQALHVEHLVGSLIVLQELHFGAERHHDPESEREAIRRILADVEIVPFDEGDMITAAHLRGQLAKRGRPIGAYDLLVAGQALARGWTVVTANTTEFVRIDGLNVIDWTAPAD